TGHNLPQAQLLWPVLMVASLVVAGLVSDSYWLFMAETVLFSIASFGNVLSLQMNILKHGSAAPELAGTSSIWRMPWRYYWRADGIPWVATLIPVTGIVLIVARAT
ncbi:hypothetical protein NLN92_24825, partial [Citrobacter portucalensis]|nr:hypothetical protein [Citrobacter portucalensis]